ncbi:MAG TPA: ferredoxin [Hyphomicrobiaceae bacterium]|nr:ferredoxin [Hyphomicrobiaceae bacterium]
MSEAEKTGPWRLVVDAERCQGHNRCHALAPDLFRIDELGFASVIRDEVPPELLEKARLAVRNCPEFAIRLTRDGAQGDDA